MADLETKIVISAEDKSKAGVDSATKNQERLSAEIDNTDKARKRLLLTIRDQNNAFRDSKKSLESQSNAIKESKGQLKTLEKQYKDLGAAGKTLESKEIKKAITATTAEIKKQEKAFDKSVASIKKQSKAIDSNNSSLLGYRNNLANLNTQLDKALSTSSKINGANNKTSQSFDKLSDSVKKSATTIEQSSKKSAKSLSFVGEQFKQLKSLAAGYFGVLAAKNAVVGIIRSADAYKEASDRIRLATSSQKEYNEAQASLFKIAQATRTELGAVNTLFARTNKSVKALGKTQKDTLSLVQLVTQAGKISGASSSESAASIRQLSQALASGVLRGDEFNSIMENSPRLAQALADSLKVSRGELRKMAEAGQLATDKVVNGLLSQSDVLDKEYGKITKSISGSLTNINNAWVKFIGNMSQSTGASSALADSLTLVADNLDVILEVGLAVTSTLAFAFGAKAVQSVIAYSAAKLASAKAHATDAKALQQNAVAQVADMRARIANTKVLISQVKDTQTLIRLRFQLVSQTEKLAAAELSLSAASKKASTGITTIGAAVKNTGIIGLALSVSVLIDLFKQLGSVSYNALPKQLQENITQMEAKFYAFGKVISSGDFLDFFNGSFSREIKRIEDAFSHDGVEEAIERNKELSKVIKETGKVQDELKSSIKRRENLEKELAREVKSISIKSSKDQIAAHKKVVSELESDIKKSKSLQEDLARSLNDLQNESGRIAESSADKIRKINRESLSDRSKQWDIQSQVNDLLKESKQLLEQGEAEEARRVANKAESISSELNGQYERIKVIKEVEAINQQAINLQKQAAIDGIAAEEEKQAALRASIEKQKEDVKSLDAALKELEKPKKIQIETNIKEVSAQIDGLQKKLEALKGGVSTASAAIGNSSVGSASNSNVASTAGSRTANNVAKTSQPTSTVNINLPSGESFGPLEADASVVNQLETALGREALKFGGRT